MDSLDIVNMLLDLSSDLLYNQTVKPNKVALMIEEVAAAAWSVAEKQGYPTWEDAELLAPSLRIDT
jgi:hypothetical protein